MNPPTVIDIPEIESFPDEDVKETVDESIPVTPEIKKILEDALPIQQKEDISVNNSCASTPSRVILAPRKNTFASLSSLGSITSGSTMSLKSVSSVKMKPPNVLVYSESPLTTENVKAVLNETLHRHK